MNGQGAKPRSIVGATLAVALENLVVVRFRKMRESREPQHTSKERIMGRIGVV